MESIPTLPPKPKEINSLNNNRVEKTLIIKNKKDDALGGWSSAFLLLANQGLATLAFFGVGVNLVLFLTRVLGQDNASAANSVSNWTGAVYLCSLLGAFLSDSYWGRYLTCFVFQLIFLLGLVLLSLSSWLLLLKPDGCGDGTQICVPVTPYGSALFYLAIYLVALGYGGHQPTIATLGADQFDEKNVDQKSSKAAFFSYFYFALNTGSFFSNTILAYFEDTGKWTIGFLAATISAVVALFAFLLGSSQYRYIKPSGNPIPRVTQVLVAAARKWKETCNDPEGLFEVEGSESAIKGSRKNLHTRELQCLDKAAIVTVEDRHGPPNPWRLCTVTQVEEAKGILRMLPIWLCTIIYSVIFTQMASLFVEQGDVMESKIGKFQLPAATMSVFDICSVLIFTGVYHQLIIPLAGRLTGNPKGLTELQRMGTGLIVGLLAMLTAGLTETERLKRVVPGRHASQMAIWWQVPQYALVGASEVFMYVGQLDFFNGQAPDGVKSLGSSLCMASMSLGNFASSMLVNVVSRMTEKGGSHGWIPQDLNQGHLDRFFFLIAALTALDFFIYLACANCYTYAIDEVENHDKESCDW